MHTNPTPTFDEVDDMLYLTRVNEAQDLQQMITELSQKYQCTPKQIVEAAVDPDNGNTVLHYCSANGFSDLLPTLLAKLSEAEGDAKIDSLIINHPNKEGNTPLHWAAYNGHLAVVKMLINAGADMWVKNAAGHLAMFEAERAGKSEVVQFLLEAGGREVERGGQERIPSAEDVADVQESVAGSSKPTNGAADVNGSSNGNGAVADG